MGRGGAGAVQEHDATGDAGNAGRLQCRVSRVSCAHWARSLKRTFAKFVVTVTEKAPTMAFSWLKAPTSTFHTIRQTDTISTK